MRLVVAKIMCFAFEALIFGSKLDIYIYHIHSQGVQIVFKVGLALLKYRHDDLVSFTGSFV